MHTCIYLSSKGLFRRHLDQGIVLALVGYCIGHSYVVVDYISPFTADFSARAPDVAIVGYIANKDNLKVDQLPRADLYLRYAPGADFPGVDPALTRSTNSYTIVVFSPPNLRNLEYFTINPIHLQSSENEPQAEPLYKVLNLHRRHSVFNNAVYISDETVLERINHCFEVRLKLHLTHLEPRDPSYAIKAVLAFWKPSKWLFFWIAQFLISNTLTAIVALLTSLNKSICGFVPVENSSFCRQLDLRLRQLSFLPIQFLCYYKGDVLSERSRKLLRLSFPNENHNIKNSNYINFYNTVWLVCNDVTLGIAFYCIWKDNTGFFHALIQKFRHYAFWELNNWICWIGSDHPWGFKLNNDLGSFMEGMLLWMSMMWEIITAYNLRVFESVQVLRYFADLTFSVVCFCGISFVLAYFVDYLKFLTLHVQFFNFSTSKIYFQQVELLKSLMQLFRGRKYNILRNRIDCIEEDDYRIDQLLLGTFCFMILVYLLPTTFAFYFFFLCAEVTILTLSKLAEKVVVIFNFFPIFVLILKLKNSRRLQGGVYFEARGSSGQTNWLVMRNRALTLENILGPFVTIFRLQGRFSRVLLNFLEGKRVIVQDCTHMKFRYLMLPEDYSHLVEVWRSI